jgi:hypothetical protein
MIWFLYGAVTSRTQVPPVKEASTVASSPTVELIGVKLASIQFVRTYSGFVADSVVPDGEMVKTVVPVPTHDARIASTSAEPYDKKKVIDTSTVWRPPVKRCPVSPKAVDSSES